MRYRALYDWYTPNPGYLNLRAIIALSTRSPSASYKLADNCHIFCTNTWTRLFQKPTLYTIFMHKIFIGLGEQYIHVQARKNEL